MSIQVQCPICDHVSKDDHHGLTFTDDDAEKIMMSNHDMEAGSSIHDLSDHVSTLIHRLGKDTFWCECGDAVWMGGRWLICHKFFLQETGR